MKKKGARMTDSKRMRIQGKKRWNEMDTKERYKE